MPPSRVGVIFGSRNTEHEVSIVTGLQVIGFLAKRHEAIPIYITKDGAWLTGAKLAQLETYKKFDPKDPDLNQVVITPDAGLQAILNPSPKGVFNKPKKLELDVVFPAIHGLHGEDGTIQGLLELANLPYTGSGVLASSISIDKVLTKVVLSGHGLPVLDYVWLYRADWEQDEDAVVRKIESMIPYPLIIKPARLGSSIGVVKAANRDELKFNISVASHYDSKIIVEPFVNNRLEVNCSVLGNSGAVQPKHAPHPSVCEQPISRADLLSYEDKYLHGQSGRGMEGAKRIIPAPVSAELTEQIQKMAVEAFQAVDASGVIRVDILLDQDTGKVYINEINTLPGSIAYYLWQDKSNPGGSMAPEQLVDELIELAHQRFQDKNRSKYGSDQLLLQNIDLMSLHKV
jgi:D-alanine-D-alanine ligase